MSREDDVRQGCADVLHLLSLLEDAERLRFFGTMGQIYCLRCGAKQPCGKTHVVVGPGRDPFVAANREADRKHVDVVGRVVPNQPPRGPQCGGGS